MGAETVETGQRRKGELLIVSMTRLGKPSDGNQQILLKLTVKILYYTLPDNDWGEFAEPVPEVGLS